MPLTPHIKWRDGQPYASEFQDVYFSTDHGLQETEYVFLQGNDLTQRWRNLSQQTFTIAETGFGTGLNFLCAAKLWLALAPKNAHLHFISSEKYPLSLTDVTQALALWPELSLISTPFLAEYTHAVQSGTPLTLFESRIKLSLLIGDATQSLQALNLNNTSVDAWFLDGFSPDKNPEMWQPALFAQIAALSNTQSTFATFTSAGDVRRGLIAAGFAVQKKTGFGKKREMLTGSLVRHIGDEQTPKHAVIIGAGIAGCSTAYALAQRGIRITLIERNAEIANEASGNPLAMLYPRLSRDDAASEFALAGYLYSLRLYTSLALGPNDFNVCGLLQLGFNAKELARIQKVAAQHYPIHIVKPLNAIEASAFAGINITHDALYFPDAAWVNPKALCQRLITHKNITLITLTNVNNILKNNDLFEIFSGNKLISSADIVVLANAYAAQQLLPDNAGNAMQLSTVRGQISVLKSTAESSQLQSIVCSDGYLSPTLNQQHCLGATFTPDNDKPEVTIDDHQANLAKLARISPALAQNLQPNIIGGRVSVRCTTTDYFPLTGEMLDSLALQSAPPRPSAKASSLPWSKGLYINVGHGSKGFSTAPICAELLASAICNEALPITPMLAANLNPNRFLLRTLGLKRLAQILPTCSELSISG